MLPRNFSSWSNLSSNLTSYLYFPRILGPFMYYSSDSEHLRNNSVDEGKTDFKSTELNVRGKGKLKKTTDKKRITTNVVEPPLEIERRKEIHSVVGIHLGPKSLYWAKIDRNRDVLEWKYVDLFPTVEIGRKMQLPKIFAMMDCISENIPFSDIFVLEAPNHGMMSSVSSPAVISAAMLRSQMIAILLTILNLRIENEDNVEEYYHKVFLLKPRIVSRFFNLLIGTERVSALALVELILHVRGSSLRNTEIINESKTKGNPNTSTSNDDPLPTYTPIQVPSSIKDAYQAMEAVEQEAMSQALLITMAFYDLVVFKEVKSLAPKHN